jgi:Spy/CpxP family protein refolding chaperone
VRQLARALAVAHGQGVIHRDLKPANVMLGPNGEPVIMDFGLARRADKGDVRLTHSGAIMGTPAYMSPEQAAGDPAAVGPGSDIYSLGVMLYQLATGRLPFDGTLADVLYKIRTQEPKPPTALRPDLSPQLEGIIMRAMAKSVEKRYASADDFAAALDDYLRQEEPRTGPVNRVAAHLTRPAGAARATRPPVRWLRWAVAAALLGGLALLLALIVIHYRDKNGNGKTVTVPAEPGSTVRVTDPTGKVLATAQVPPEPAKPKGKPTPGAKAEPKTVGIVIPRVQDLSLTEEQEAKIADIRQEYKPKVEEAGRELAAVVEEEVEKVRAVLTAEQREKIKETREEGRELQTELLAEQIAHVEELDLTDREMTKFGEIRKEYHPKIVKTMERLKALLTDEQKKTREESLKHGKKRREVIESLNLTDEQKDRGEALGKELRSLIHEALDKMRDVLTEGQNEKLQEFKGERKELVRDRMAHMIATLKDLNLTEEQKTQIADIRKEYRPKVQEAGNKLRGTVKEEVEAILAVIKR